MLRRPPPSARPTVLRHLGGVLSGVALAAAFEPVDQPWLAPLALVALFGVIRGQRLRAGATIGACFGLGFLGLHLFWLRLVSWAAWGALVAAETVFFALLGVLVAWAWRRRAPALWLAAVWLAVEGLRSTAPFGGMPWGQLGFTVVDTPWVRDLPYLGVPLTGFVLALIAGLVAARRLLPLLLVVAVASAPLVLAWTTPTHGSFRVVAMQPGLDADRIAPFHYQVTEGLAEQTLELSRQVAGGVVPQPDLVVWPENSTAVDPFLDARDHGAITLASQQLGAPILVGAMVEAKNGRDVANVGILWEPDGTTEQGYVKQHPVPWGEYLPFRDQLGWLHFGDVLPSRDMLHGSRTTPLDVDGVKVADAICFDVAHAAVLRDQIHAGAELVTVQTSNVTYGGSAQLRQQFDITRARAAESGRVVVVSSINGISGVIGPDGSVRAEAPVVEGAVLQADVALHGGLTPAIWLGAWPWRLITLIVTGSILATLRSPRGQRNVEPVGDAVTVPDNDAPGEGHLHE